MDAEKRFALDVRTAFDNRDGQALDRLLREYLDRHPPVNPPGDRCITCPEARKKADDNGNC